MSALETLIRIRVQNDASNGLDDVAESAEEMERKVQKAMEDLRNRLRSSMQDVQRGFRDGLRFDTSNLNNLASMQEAAFRRMSESARRVFEQTRTPLERQQAEQAELNSLLQAGAIDADTYARAMRRIEQDTDRLNSTSNRFAGVLNHLKGLFAGLFATLGAQELLHTADQMSLLNNQIKQVTNSEAEYLTVKKELLGIANRTTSDLEATTTLYTRSKRALQDYGYTQQEVLKFTETTANMMYVSGVAAQEQAAALRQLGQALGKGNLNGDEFVSIAEGAPILLDVVAQYMGKTRGELKELASDGKITSDILFNAISGAAEKFAAKAGELPMTFGQSITVLKNNWKTFIDGLMNSSGFMTAIANSIKFVADHLNSLASAIAIVGIGFLTQQMAAFTLSVGAASGAFTALKAILLANPFTAVAAAIATVLVATGEMENAMAAIGTVTSDVIDLISDGYEGLADLISAVYHDITGSAEQSTATQTGLFNGFFDDCGTGFYGLLQSVGKVMDGIAGTIRACCVHGINAFSGLWNALASGAVSAANSAIAQVERLINSVVSGINRLIGMVNSIGGSVASIGAVSLGRLSAGSSAGGASPTFGETYAQVMASQQANGLQSYFKNVQQRNTPKGGVNLGGPRGKRTAPLGSDGGKGGGGGKGGKKGSGKGGKGGQDKKGKAARDTRLQDWTAELELQKLVYQEQELRQNTHNKWQLSNELKFWQDKLRLVDNNSKIGIDIRKKVFGLHSKIYDEHAKKEEQRLSASLAAEKYHFDVAEQLADTLLTLDKLSQAERLELELEFEQERYDLAVKAMNDRIALAKADPERDTEKLAQLYEQLLELERQFELKKMQIKNKQEVQRRKETPTFWEKLDDGKGNVWQEMQNQMEQTFTAILSRTQTFRQAMNNLFKNIGQTFILELVTKPLMAETMKYIKTTGIYQMLFGQQIAMQSAASAAIIGAKATETTAVVSDNAVQAASGAAASQASIPYVGPILAVAAMGAMMGAVMGLLGGKGNSTTTTITRIPSAAGGWDIPAGINPLTQLHEREMVLPAEHADTIRGLSSSGSGETIIINTAGGDFIHKKDLAKLLKQLKRDFKFN